MPRTKWALLILACLMLAGGIAYWQKDGGAGPEIVREELLGAGTVRAAESKETAGPSERSETAIKTVTAETLEASEAAEITEAAESSETAETSRTVSPPAPQTVGEWIFATEPLLVNINAASADELEKLPGIGPAKALAILQYRAENGPFRTREELMKVPGIKEGTFNKIKAYVTV